MKQECEQSKKNIEKYISHLSRQTSGQNMSHYENTPFKIYRKYHLQKLKIFR